MRAFSKIVALVIMVSVALMISTIIGLWLAGVAGQYTSLERLDIVAGYARIIVDKYNTEKPPVVMITLVVENRGSKNITIDAIFINSKPTTDYGGIVNVSTPLPLNLPVASKTSVQINLSSTIFQHGQMVEVELHTSSGGRYVRTIEIP